ncbi:MAG TPA: right-handed parallel beta-helix repeat-containing protein, partial [Saprospiraceae bacterium]|nr:right-handed parallel beta-helix repeat-containing protein [Saprospiraceae bacterium]
IIGNDRVATDHWVIAARPETPHVVVPWELEKGMPPHGERRFFASLAIIRWTLQGRTVLGQVVHDCRKTFRPLTDQECCCTYTVGDGVNSHGDFISIQEALDNLPVSGGKICVLPGIHYANVLIHNRQKVRITGCGIQSMVRPARQQLSRPIFQIENSDQIQIDQLTLVTYTGTAIELADQPAPLNASRKIRIDHNEIIALVHAIRIVTPDDSAGDNEIRITHNQIAMLDKMEGKVAIFCLADDVVIERNRIGVVPQRGLPRTPIPDTVTDAGDLVNTVFDPCAPPEFFYSEDYPIEAETRSLLAYYQSNVYIQAAVWNGYLAMGGIQIAGTSEKVWILQNEIVGGRGNGITLGHLPDVEINDTAPLSSNFSYNSTAILIDEFGNSVSAPDVVSKFNNSLYDITIQENTIQRMGLSGISAVAFLSTRNVGLLVRVEDFWIYGNTIMYCARQIPAVFPRDMLHEFAFGGIALADAENGSIRENRIEENGLSHIDPICGIFFLRGEKIDISDNRIVNNGPGTLTTTETQKAGYRGGIVINFSFKSLDFNALQNTTTPSFDGIPAVKVHDNIVIQPLGHALFMVAFGPVSVVGNQFTSQGIDRLNPNSNLAGAVYIYNLGMSKDFRRQIVGPSSRNLFRADPQAAYTAASNTRMVQLNFWLEYLPSGRVMFTSNQTTLDMRSPYNNLGLSAQMIYSQDDIAFNTNQSECVALSLPNQGGQDRCLYNTYLLAASIRSNDNRFTEGLTLTRYSLFSIGIMNTALGNQSTHCLHVIGNQYLMKEVNNIVLYSSMCKIAYQTLTAALDVPPISATPVVQPQP